LVFANSKLSRDDHHDENRDGGAGASIGAENVLAIDVEAKLVTKHVQLAEAMIESISTSLYSRHNG
jgi:hypothetical protein